MTTTTPKALSVSQLNLYVKSILECDRNLKSVWVSGEIYNFVCNSKSGHCYFSLRDRDASVKAVMFQWQASSLTFRPQDGMKVLIRGHISLYERDGQYQLYAEQMLPDGLGAAYLDYLRLRDQLEKEGLFSAKKSLPSYPSSIGICTSPTGAALHDIVSVCGRLAPWLKICVYPCLMQGASAPASVTEGLNYFRTRPGTDLVVIARGGGSYEDLAVFNDEALARTVAAFPIPVISAIGHEIDFTILDFAADFRAATPSVAAEVAVGQAPALAERLARVRHSLKIVMSSRLELEAEVLSGLTRSLNPERIFSAPMQRLDTAEFRLRSSAERLAERRTAEFAHVTARLSALNPLFVLSRGFAVAEKDGTILHSSAQISVGDRFELNFEDGVIGCAAESKKQRKL